MEEIVTSNFHAGPGTLNLAAPSLSRMTFALHLTGWLPQAPNLQF